MKKLLITLSVLVISSFSPQIPKPEPRPEPQKEADLSSQKALYAALINSGLDPITQDWVAINPMCMSLPNKHETNKCKLQKAMLNSQYRADSKVCTEQAIAEYPDSLLKDKFLTATEKDSEDKLNTIKIKEEGISAFELKSKRTASRNGCMKSFGWNSSNDWKLGKAQ